MSFYYSTLDLPLGRTLSFSIGTIPERISHTMRLILEKHPRDEDYRKSYQNGEVTYNIQNSVEYGVAICATDDSDHQREIFTFLRDVTSRPIQTDMDFRESFDEAMNVHRSLRPEIGGFEVLHPRRLNDQMNSDETDESESEYSFYDHTVRPAHMYQRQLSLYERISRYFA